MKKNIKGLILITIIIFGFGTFHLLKIYKENKKVEKLIYNNEVLIKTLKVQEDYIIKSNNCPSEVKETIESIYKYLKMNESRLLNYKLNHPKYKIKERVKKICSI